MISRLYSKMLSGNRFLQTGKIGNESLESNWLTRLDLSSGGRLISRFLFSLLSMKLERVPGNLPPETYWIIVPHLIPITYASGAGPLISHFKKCFTREYGLFRKANYRKFHYNQISSLKKVYIFIFATKK